MDPLQLLKDEMKRKRAELQEAGVMQQVCAVPQLLSVGTVVRCSDACLTFCESEVSLCLSIFISIFLHIKSIFCQGKSAGASFFKRSKLEEVFEARVEQARAKQNEAVCMSMSV
jgi:hypothetical protein